METLIITVKTDFYKLIFQMLANNIGPKSPKNSCDILT